ncbi:hypothetical protein DPMN_137235 [Dreissena polymorpha]|uniref:Transposable element P transposase-like RNase H domain-containing protein n=1 Tax=Dreissena polymorpha TaxID=45954 RepID=A0A9D4G290_DREPO|nr:hypothetical protein DPMN_137235 [Dreissena polymorpha]
MHRNALKQEAGFDPNVFEWMYEEANKNGLEECDRLGEIIFDEMSIQQDIQIEKNGSVLELNGFTELGMCQQLRKDSKSKTLGTHILQLLFLGLNGFRFPFAFLCLIMSRHLSYIDSFGRLRHTYINLVSLCFIPVWMGHNVIERL